MKAFIKLLFVLAILTVAFGFYRGWFSLSRAPADPTGKKVDIRVVVDPTVLGGLVTTVGDTVIDGSVRSRLDQLKQHI